MIWAHFKNENETKGRHPGGRPTSRLEHCFRKDVTQNERGRKMRRTLGRQTDGQALLPDDLNISENVKPRRPIYLVS